MAKLKRLQTFTIQKLKRKQFMMHWNRKRLKLYIKLQAKIVGCQYGEQGSAHPEAQDGRVEIERFIPESLDAEIMEWVKQHPDVTQLPEKYLEQRQKDQTKENRDLLSSLGLSNKNEQ